MASESVCWNGRTMLSRNACTNGATQRIKWSKIIANLLAIALIGSFSFSIASAQRQLRRPGSSTSPETALTSTEIADALAAEDLELPQGAKALLQVPENRESVSRLVNLTEAELAQQNKAAIENASDVKNRLLTTGRWVSVDGQREMKQAEFQVTLVRLAKVVRVAIIQKKDNQAAADARELKEGRDGAFASLRTNSSQGTPTKLSNEIIQLSRLPAQQLMLLRDTKPSGSREWSIFNAALDLRNERDRTQREAEAEAQRAAERARLQEAERKKQEAAKLVREQEVKRFSVTSYGQEIRSACVATVERNGTIQDPLPPPCQHE